MYNFTFAIDENNAVWISDGVNPEPCIFQPDWPDTTPWANKAEAEAWARQWILSMEDETADLPGFNPSQPTVARPVEIIEAELE